MTRVGRVFATAALLGASAARAHDFWIEPSSFRPAPGVELAVRLRVGERFEGRAVARDPAHARRFVLIDARGATPVAGRAGDEPARRVRVGAAGVAVLGFRSGPTRIDLGPEQFEAYLRDEGLEHVSRTRAEHGETGAPGREVFSRCAKALLAVGDGGAGHDRLVGFPLELVPERNPYRLRAGDELPVLLRHEGAPLEGALVIGLHHDGEPLRGRTDAAGRVRLRLPRPGPWLVKAVHMRPAPDGSGADWESLWASLTFELAGG